MSEQEYIKLRDDIAENGLQEPITLYEGQILDGRHRAKACRELGIEAATHEYEGDHPEAFVLSAEGHWRTLTTAQKALVVLDVLPAYRKRALGRKAEGGRKGGQQAGRGRPTIGTANVVAVPIQRAVDEAAAKIGLTGRTVEKLDRLRTVAPDLFECVRAGEQTIGTADRVLRERASGNGKVRPRTPTLDSERGRELAGGAKKRVERAVGTCNGLARGLGDLRVDWAVSVADSEEINGWDEAFKEAIAALQHLRKRVKECR